MVKIGIRTPSVKRSIKARTTGKLKRSVKRSINPVYGKKGTGLITNPKKSIYNSVYHKTTIGVNPMSKISTSKKTAKPTQSSKVKSNKITAPPIKPNQPTGKDSATAWGLWLLFGGLGGHRYYLNRKLSALIMTLLPLFTAGYGFFITIPWMIYDATQINKWLRTINEPAPSEASTESPVNPVEAPEKVVTTPISDSPEQETVPSPTAPKIKPQPRSTITHKQNIVKLRKDLFSFVVLDIETTGLSAQNEGITQVSALKYVDNVKVAQFNKYVNPEHDIPKKVQFLTHITPEMVNNEPVFAEIVPELRDFISELPIIGHNINFDINFLTTHGYTDQQIFVEDTVTIARMKLPELENYKLETLKKHYGIINQSHNALDDCETTAIIYQQMRDGNTEKVIIDSEPLDTSDKLTGLRFCITGQFMDMTRDEIRFMIEQNGGRVTGSLSKLTDYLIDGEQVANNLTDGIHSAAELKAQELIKNGNKIQIINLDELSSLVAQ